MAALSATPKLIAAVFLDQCMIRSQIVGPGGIVAGQTIAVSATGRAVPCNTATAGQQQARGIALQTLGPGQAVDVLLEGYVSGFDLSNLAYDALVYAQDTDGAIGDAPGTKTVPIGRCVALSDRNTAGNPSKLLYVRFSATTNY